MLMNYADALIQSVFKDNDLKPTSYQNQGTISSFWPPSEVVHLQPGHLAVVPVGGVGRLDDVQGLRPNSI